MNDTCPGGWDEDRLDELGVDSLRSKATRTNVDLWRLILWNLPSVLSLHGNEMGVRRQSQWHAHSFSGISENQLGR